jgi:hypothetical protein
MLVGVQPGPASVITMRFGPVGSTEILPSERQFVTYSNSASRISGIVLLICTFSPAGSGLRSSDSSSDMMDDKEIEERYLAAQRDGKLDEKTNGTAENAGATFEIERIEGRAAAGDARAGGGNVSCRERQERR